MGAANKGRSSPLLPPAVDRALRWLVGPGKHVTILLILVAVLGGGWYLVWPHVGPWVLSQKDYQLSVGNIEITPPPDWIHGRDVRREAFLDSNLPEITPITEPGLVERIRSAFAAHPWVAKVVSVQKFHPARVKVVLVYRMPVCVVQVGDDLIPVDIEGTVLPEEDFSPVEKQRYPPTRGDRKRPSGAGGNAVGRSAGRRRSGDRSAPGADLATRGPGGDRPPGHTRRLAVTPEPGRFELRTRRGRWIVWGFPPSAENSREPKPAEKLARLEAHLQQQGTLDVGPEGARVLDLSHAVAGDVNASGPGLPPANPAP